MRKLFTYVSASTTTTSQNLIREEIKKKMNSSNACYHLFQNLLSSLLLYKIINIRTYKTLILSVLLYGYETLSVTLREEHRSREFENRTLRRILDRKEMK
jgi:hypothetical protein